MYILLFFILFTTFVLYRYYYKPKLDIQRYKAILKSLGYKVYEMPFTFLGLSAYTNWKKGGKLHNDEQYFERTVLPHVDVAIGNTLDKAFVNIVNPDLIKEFLSIDMINKYPKFLMMLSGIRATTGDGIVMSQGETWKNKRKLMSKVFNFDLVKENIEQITKICNRCYDYLEKTHEVNKTTFKYDPLALSSRIFNGVMMKCFFGSDMIEEEINGQKFEEFIMQTANMSAEVTMSPLMIIFGKLAWNLAPTQKIRKVKENIRLLKQKSMEILKKRTEEVMSVPKRQRYTDIIEALVYEKLQNKEQFSYSDDDLIGQFRTFLVAGTDTTSRFFTMIIYFLGKYPEIHKKLRQQVDLIIKTDADITYQNLRKLTYLDWIQYETSRHYGPINGIAWRIATEDNMVSNITITKGTIVTVQPRGNHYNPKYFKNPEQFRPERWESQCDGIHPYAFIGFSAGPRSCIGKQLAHIESKIAIVKLIKRYEAIEAPKEVYLKVGLLYEAKQFDVVLKKRQES